MLAREKDARDLEDPFSQYIKIKVNAPELLRKELSRLPKEIIYTGDYQPVEAKFNLSREMLKVCLDLGFPVLINEKSPFVLKDLDLIKDISEKSWACVLWSISNHTSEGYSDIFEPNLPSIESRFKTMKKIAEAGVLTGTAFMPILPFITDSDDNLEAIVKKTAEFGGRFVLAGSLTMSGAQATRYMQIITRHCPEVAKKYRALYNRGYIPKCEYTGGIGEKVKKLCEKQGISDRMPRYIPPGKTAVNKKVAERLLNETYYMELRCENKYRILAYRKASWGVDEIDKDIKQLYYEKGLEGLKTIPGVGSKLSLRIEEELLRL